VAIVTPIAGLDRRTPGGALRRVVRGRRVRIRGGGPAYVRRVQRRGQSGQAALESIGVTVVVAVVLAAVSTWLVHEVRPPPRPPDVITAVATPLVRDPGLLEWRYPLPQEVADLRGADDEPIGRALRIVARRSRAGVGLSLEMNAAFDDAFKARLRERGREFLDDPLAELVSMPNPVLLTPDGALLRSLQDAAALWAYARELRSMPLREAALRASHDAGRHSADLAIEVAEALMRRGVRRAGSRIPRRRAPAPTPAPAPSPEPAP
jgi:hypothetical protein